MADMLTKGLNLSGSYFDSYVYAVGVAEFAHENASNMHSQHVRTIVHQVCRHTLG